MSEKFSPEESRRLLTPRVHWLRYVQEFCLPVGVVCLALCILLGFFHTFRASFFSAYEFGWLFWLGVSLGSMGWTLMNYLTGGGWGRLTRPITIAAGQTLPLLAVLFIPLFFGFSHLFPWASPDRVQHDAVLMHERVYLNSGFFTIRFFVYFIVWSALIWTATTITYGTLVRRISAGGLVIYVALMTLAGVDWVMSRQPHWTSTIFGFVWVISQVFTAIIFTNLLVWQRADRPEIQKFFTPDLSVDLGNLLLTLVILWAYMNFCQFLITWTGNEQTDIAFFVARTYGGWRALAGIIVFGHFLIPFFLLLFRDLKKDINRLGWLCAAMFVLRICDMYWHVAPMQWATQVRHRFQISPEHFLAFFGIGGIWFWFFDRLLARQPFLAPQLTTEEEEAHGARAPQPG